MIPQRRLSRSSVGNGVSCRREACRRRLRLVRASDAQSPSKDSAAEWATDSGGANAEAASLVVGFETKGQDEVRIT